MGISKMAYQGDIVSRLRNWRGLHLSHGGQLYDEAADEIEHLRVTPEECLTMAYLVAVAFKSKAQYAQQAKDTLGKLIERNAYEAHEKH